MTGFLHRVTRYVASDDRNPREDRLTEITAAVLERVPGLGRELALGWLDPSSQAHREIPSERTASLYRSLRALPSDTPVETTTQRVVGERRVDLELRFRDQASGGQVAVLWVEVKHGTDPHSGQVPAYVMSCPQPGAVVLLSTRARLPADPQECPSGVPQRTWESTAQRARDFARNAELDDPIASWLFEEWLGYLKEEGLVALESLGPEHMSALMYYAEAETALGPLCEAAMQELGVDEHRGFDQLGGAQPRYGLRYWAKWDMGATDEEQRLWDGAWFDWKIIRSSGQPHGIPTGHVFVMAGLSKGHGGEFASPDPQWNDGLSRGLAVSSGRITFRRWRGDHERLQRVAYLHQIVRGQTLAEQGREVGAWVAATQEALLQHGPPLSGDVQEAESAR